MKKLLSVVIVLLVAVLMALTVPDKQAHKEAMMKVIEEYVADETQDKLGSNVLAKFGKNLVTKTIEVALDSKLQVHNYVLLNTTSAQLKGKDQLLSVGVFGHVFTFDKEMLREKLEEAVKSKGEDKDKARAGQDS